MVTDGEDLPGSTFMTEHQTISQTQSTSKIAPTLHSLLSLVDCLIFLQKTGSATGGTFCRNLGTRLRNGGS